MAITDDPDRQELRAHFESDILIFLKSFRVYLLSEFDHGLEVDIGLFFLQPQIEAMSAIEAGGSAGKKGRWGRKRHTRGTRAWGVSEAMVKEEGREDQVLLPLIEKSNPGHLRHRANLLQRTWHRHHEASPPPPCSIPCSPSLLPSFFYHK